ncbi:MAG: filamentous hemagglutinin N-terminal domain-containing protein [Rhizobiaceae bacterium]|nr:filamentous hemagglutinin N-terminal domain-containing protein [Rhizobiaceae bacterium]
MRLFTPEICLPGDRFSVGNNHSVNFQNGSGAMQNRVTGNNISTINGRLTATGSVFLINRNGVIIGKNGVIETGGSIPAPNGTAALITEREDWGCQFFNHRTGHDCCSQGGVADQWGQYLRFSWQ